MSFEFTIPGPEAAIDLSVNVGGSMIFVGANGGGKTRLAVFIEETVGINAHRISAHRALILNPSVAKIGEQAALMGVRTGKAREGSGSGARALHRWGSKAATHLLSDFDYLVQALFAEQSNKSLETHTRVRSGDHSPAEPTKFEQLVEIWSRLLPHRRLRISGDDIRASIEGSDATYSASEMSDGERAVFYMIGQALVAAENSLLIVDEPELHVHRSIMAKLWDELEAARPDCAYVFITHDLEFAATRAAQKFVIRDFQPAPSWMIDEVPETEGFDEELVSLILGSRRPILFVEGGSNSLDLAVYRCTYPDWTIVARGSCEQVIRSVTTMRANEAFTRVSCGGIVDADGRDQQDIDRLNALGVYSLPVSEIENVFLLPRVANSIAISDGYEPDQIEDRLDAMYNEIFALIEPEEARDTVAVRNCRRRIDGEMKKLSLSAATSTADLTEEFSDKVASIDVGAIVNSFREVVDEAVTNRDVRLLLSLYDNKSMLAIAARHLKASKKSDFEGWLTRILRNNSAPGVADAIRYELPNLTAP